jgi:hypothetical protein
VSRLPEWEANGTHSVHGALMTAAGDVEVSKFTARTLLRNACF